MREEIDAILDFWFGELDGDGMPRTGRNALWFRASPETDDACRERFGALHARGLRGELDGWIGDDRGLVALIVLLDQFSRNIHRGTAGAFAGDARALAFSLDALDSGRHRELPPIHRVFLYMPLEHSEDLDLQDTCVALFEELASATGDDRIAGFARYAVAHRDVIARFGRFPHRNAVLGRESSAEELEHLREHGGF